MARLPLPPAERLIRNVNIALTEAQYQHFKKLAGHTLPIVRAGSQKPMPGRRRSIASLIRELITSGQRETATNLTVNQQQALIAMAAMAYDLNQLAMQANAQGYDLVAKQTNALVNQLRALLSVYELAGRPD